MSRRPGENGIPGCVGCFIFLFFIPFAAIGLGMVRQAIKELYGNGFMPAVAMLGLMGAVFSAVGLGGLITIARAGLRRRRGLEPMKLPKPVPTGWKGNPWFPELKNRKLNTSGRIALEPQTSNWGGFVGMSFMAVIWNGLSWTAFIAILRQRDHSNFAAAFIGLFVLIGAAILYAAIKQLLRCLLVGDTGVELSQEPVPAGASATLTLRQRGDFPIEQLDLTLVAQEVVTHGSGTDRTTHRETVHSELIVSKQKLRARQQQSLLQAEFKIPADAAGSFQAPNNEITWSIRVQMKIAGRPDVDQHFPFRVTTVGGART